jgi:hypothetical protein
MSFSDPSKVKVDGTTEVELPRVSTGDKTSSYANSDGTIELVNTTRKGRRTRHEVRLNLAKVIASALNPSQNEEVSTSAYLVVDRPIVGYTNEELRKLVEGLKTFLSEANIKKILGAES